KAALDEWYIRNASLQLDLRILYMTLLCVFKGERRSEAAIDAAFALRRRQSVVWPLETLVTRALATSNVEADAPASGAAPLFVAAYHTQSAGARNHKDPKQLYRRAGPLFGPPPWQPHAFGRELPCVSFPFGEQDRPGEQQRARGPAPGCHA